MTRDEYWALIDRTREESGGEPDDHEAALLHALGALPPEDIIDFERHSSHLLASSYSDRLWGAAYLINGGCSDDGFDYFRGWLVAQGRAVYEGALADPDSLVDCPGLREDVELEGMWYVARRAYEAKTGKAMPEDVGPPSAEGSESEASDFGEDVDFDDDEVMRKHYPRLWERFCGEES